MVKLAARLPLALVSLALAADALVDGPWSSTALSPEDRARLLVENMTLDEKLNFLHGTGNGEINVSARAYTGNVLPISRLGIPPITMNDGPQGFRSGGIAKAGTSTAWPSGLTIAASWDVDAVYEWGAGMGKEFYDKGANVQLGPGVCVARVPRNGRNFEYISGEDPFLGKVLVQPAVRGIQSQKVVANAKHFVLNNQETDRTTESSETDQRTRFEMYYPPFEGAIDADVGSVMCGYNKINGVWSCENPVTLGELKKELGFKGYVMSDWGATHSASIMAGLDMEQPADASTSMVPETLKPALEAGSVLMAAVDESVRRIFRPMFAVGVMDEPLSAWDWKKRLVNVTSAASVASARRLSAASTVLLKNANSVLPFPATAKKLAVIGFADTNVITHGGGSGQVEPSYTATPLQGIKAALGAKDEMIYNDGTNITAASELASSVDYAVIFVGTLSSEGGDRASLSLDDGVKGANQQNALVAAVAKANPKTIVVASVPGAVLMPWSADVAAILTNFMPGQQAGTAIADVLFGDVNPSAKLPLTFPNVENETQFTPDQWPGTAHSVPRDFYTEKLLIGYRYYDAHNISFTTGFPFGHGLSYTEFEYSDLVVSGTAVSFNVKNTGKVPGSEVPQLYLGFPSSAGEPPLQLKGFQKTQKLAPGQTQAVTLLLAPRDFSIWDTGAGGWSLVQGTFAFKVGSSSRDIRLSASFVQASESKARAVYI